MATQFGRLCLYGELNEKVKRVLYTGGVSSTAEVSIDGKNNIQVNVLKVPEVLSIVDNIKGTHITYDGSSEAEVNIPNYTVVKDTTIVDPNIVAAYDFKLNGETLTTIEIPVSDSIESAYLDICTEVDVPLKGLQVGDAYLDFAFKGKEDHLYVDLSKIVTQTQLDAIKTVVNSLEQRIATVENNVSTNTTHLTALDSEIKVIKDEANANSDSIKEINRLIPNTASPDNQLTDKNFVNSSISTNTATFIGTFGSITELRNQTELVVTNNDYAFVKNAVITNPKTGTNIFDTFSDLTDVDKNTLTNYDYAYVVNGDKYDLYRFDITAGQWMKEGTVDTPSTQVINADYNRYKATVSNGTVSWAFEYTLNNSSFTAAQWAAINSGITDVVLDQLENSITGLTNNMKVIIYEEND